MNKEGLKADIAKLEADLIQTAANANAIHGALTYARSLLEKFELAEKEISEIFDSTPVAAAVTAPIIEAKNNDDTSSACNGTARS
jgi:hypothetical protein